MPARRDKPEDRDVAYEHLLGLCRRGMLYEVEEWLNAGHSAARPEEARHCPLRIATEKGFHSLVKVLLRHDCSADQKLGALEEAARTGNLEVAKLLVEAGAPVERLPFWFLDEVVSRPLLEYLLDHGLDLTRRDGLANMLVCRRIKPLLGLFLQNRERFPAWEEQAAKALCEFISKRDLKWVALMVWAKTDPHLKVGSISEELDPEVDEDDKRSAAEIALLHGKGEIFQMLKLKPTTEQANELLRSAWLTPDLGILEMLLGAGADLNNSCDGEGSLLHQLLSSFGWSCDTRFSHRDSRKEVEKIAWLIRRGGKWILPEREGALDSLRRSFYRDSGDLAVEVIRLLDAGDACDKDLLREFIDKPKLSGWVRCREPELFERLMGV